MVMMGSMGEENCTFMNNTGDRICFPDRPLPLKKKGDKMKGTVEAISMKENPERYSLKIGEEWYSGFGRLPEGIEKGSEVELEFVQKGIFRNIEKIVKITPKELSPGRFSEDSEKSDRIIRSVALKCAVEMEQIDFAGALVIAKEFEKYLRGGYRGG
jgi:hypothetical protein